MLSEIETISDRMTHQGEKGRNNEYVLAAFLNEHLPQRYCVSTGKREYNVPGVFSLGCLLPAPISLITYQGRGLTDFLLRALAQLLFDLQG